MDEKKFRHMNLEQRIKIKEMLDLGHGVSEIAEDLGYCYVTIYKELERCGSQADYNPYYAQSIYKNNSKKKGRIGKLSNAELAKLISDLILIEHLSPEKIVALLKEDNRGFSNVPHSAKTIYSAIDKGLIPNVTREVLMRNVSTVFSGGHICIPKWVLDKMDIKDGDMLSFEITKEDEIVYRKVKNGF